MKPFVSLVLFVLIGSMASAMPVNAATDIAPPILASAGPANSKTCVGLGSKVAIVFNEAMDPFSINTESLTVTDPSGVRVFGNVRYEDATTITRNLSQGSQGEDVSRLQQFLIDGGLLNVPTPNGYFGFQTKAAVIAWQRASGLAATGSFDAASRARFSMAVFTPVGALASNTKYVAAITSAARDTSGNTFTSAVGWYFTTGPCGTSQPGAAQVTTSAPASNGFDVKFNPINISGGPTCTSDNTAAAITFTSPVDPATLSPNNISLLDQEGVLAPSRYAYLQLHNIRPNLAFGSKGEDVAKLQVFLHALGYFSRTIPTQNFGNGTKLALIAWQKSIGIKATGIFDKTTSDHAHVLILTPIIPMEGDFTYSIAASDNVRSLAGNPLAHKNKRSLITKPDCAPGLVGLRGPIGIQGIQGIQGILGALGETGAQGLVGLTGPQGATGTTGITGETGIQGGQGSSGGSGATGATGATGVAGPVGAGGGSLEATIAHATIKDTTSQFITDTEQPQVVTFNENKELYLIDHSTSVNTSRIYPLQEGRYRITTTVQISGGGVFALWLRKNGVDVPNTTRVTSNSNGYTTNSLLNVVDVVPGDYFEIIQSSSVPEAGITSVNNFENPAAPTAPAAILHIIRTGASI